jgi:branched-chain amino acid transport system ATP-binding protein
LLTLEGVDVRYGAIQALRGVNLTVQAGEIVTLIGANGAGKSTTIRTVSGLVRPSAGRVLLDGEDVSSLPPHKLVERGVCQSPEGRRVFANMTVTENLELGAYIHHGKREQVSSDRERVLALFPRLKERLKQAAGTLSGGEQQMLAIGRALMSRPRLLMLDEPSLGLAPFLVQQIFHIIRDINQQGVTILLVEQNAYQALRVASRGYVLETGRIVMDDRAESLLQNEDVRKAYLGE